MGQWHDLDHDPFAVSSAAKPAEPSGFGGAFAQGFKRALPETKSLLYGATAALGGAAGADSVRDWGLKHYQRIHDNEVVPLANQNTFQGSIKGEHSLGQWAGDTLGNFAGQGLQSAAAGLAGAAMGGAAGTPAGGVGAVPGSVLGAIGGVVAKEGGKKLIQRQVRQLMKEQVAAGASRSAARQAGQTLAQRRLAQIGGGAVASTGLNIGQEIGIGYSERAKDAQANGEALTRRDALRAIGWGIPAGLLDSAAEVVTAGRLLRGASASDYLPRRVLAGATVGAVTEGATEGLQAVMERAGANQSLTDREAVDDYIENLAAGVLGGGTMGGISGVRRRESEAPPAHPPLNRPATEPPAPADVPPNAPAAPYRADNSALVRRLLTPDADNSGPLMPTAPTLPAVPSPAARPLARRTLTGELLDPPAALLQERTALPGPQPPVIEGEYTDLSAYHSRRGLVPDARSSAAMVAPSPDVTPTAAPAQITHDLPPTPAANVTATGPLTRALTRLPPPSPTRPPLPAHAIPTDRPSTLPALPPPISQPPDRHSAPPATQPLAQESTSPASIESYRDATLHDMGIINADNLPKEQVRALNAIARQGYEAAVMGENLNPSKHLNTLERRFWAHGVLAYLNRPEVLRNTEVERHAILQRRDYEREQAAWRKEQQRQEQIEANRERAEVQRQQDLKNRAKGILSDEDAQLNAIQRWRHTSSAERATILREVGLDERLAAEHPYIPKIAEQALIAYEKAQFKASRTPKPKAPPSAQAQQWQALSAKQRQALLKQAGATDKQAKRSAAYDWQQFQAAAQQKLSQTMQLAPAAPSALPTPTPAHPTQTDTSVPTVKASKQSSAESVVPSLAKRWDTLPKPYRQMYARIMGIQKGFYKKWATLDKDMQNSLLEAARRENNAATAWNKADRAQRQDYLNRGFLLHLIDVNDITARSWAALPYLSIPAIINGHIDADYAARQNQNQNRPESTLQKENPASKQTEQDVSNSEAKASPVKDGYIRPIALKLEGWKGTASELAALARAIYTQDLQGTSVENQSLGARIAFTSEGKGEAFGAKGRVRGAVRAELVRVLPELVQSAVKVAETPPSKEKRTRDSKAFHTLLNALEVDGEVIPVRLTIREAALVPKGEPAHKFYDIVTRQNKRSLDVHGLHNGKPAARPVPVKALDIKVADLASAFNIGEPEPASAPIDKKTQTIISNSAAIASAVVSEDIAHKVYASALETLAERGVKALPENLKNQLAEVIGKAVGRAIGKATHKIDSTGPGAILGNAPTIAAKAGAKAAARLLKTFLNNWRKSQTTPENTTENKPKTAVAPLAEAGNYSSAYNNAKQQLADLVKAYQQGTLQNRGNTPELKAYLAQFEGTRRAEISKALLSDAGVSVDTGKTWAKAPAHRVAETLVNSGMLANRLNTSPTAWNGDKPYNIFVIQHDAKLGYEAALYANHLLDERARKKHPAPPAPSSPPKPPNVQPQKPDSIEDFGEKIGGARKDLAAALKAKITAGDLRSTPFSKLWPLADIGKIKDDVIAAAVTAIRAGVMKKPAKNVHDSWFEIWAKEIEQARERAQLALAGDFNKAFPYGSDVRVYLGFDLRNGDNFRLDDMRSNDAWRALLLRHLPREQWPQLKNIRAWEKGLARVEVGRGTLYPQKNETFDSFVARLRDAAEKAHNLANGSGLAFTGWSNKKGEFWFSKDGDKSQTRLIVFNSRQAYDAYRKAPDFKEKLGALWEAHKEKANIRKTDTRGKANRERNGTDWRKGQDVSPEQFSEAFGFRGVEFGNWVGKANRERQDSLNRAYDALHDLAELLNIPTRALSLSGKLGLAFGSRGKGTASAHYEPARMVINLTKTKGAGSLAHEWFHALDNYFGRDRTEALAKRLNARFDGEFITKNPIDFYIKGDRIISAKDFEAAVAAGRPTADNFKQTAKHHWTWQQIGDSVEGWTKLDGVRPEVLHAFERLVVALNQSPMSDRAFKADKSTVDKYWSQIVERAARAFENYVIASLEQKGQHNDYLANVTPEQAFQRDASIYPYLKQSELAPVKEAFDKLFSTLKTRTDDKGNVALFSRSKAQDKFSIPAEGASKVQAEAALAKLKGKPLPNVETGIDAFINSTQANKLISNAAVQKSMANGFTREQHYAIAEKIETLWAEATQVSESADKKGHPDIRIKRFAAPVIIDGLMRYAAITVKALKEYGHRVYSVEAHIEKTLRGMLDTDTANTGKPNTPARSANEIIEALSAKVNGAMPKQSRSQSSPLSAKAQQHIAQVQAQVSDTVKDWENAPEVIVVHDLSDPRIPEAVRRENAKQQSQGAQGAPEGFFYQGKVYLIASQLKTDADVARVLFHEVLGHVGLRGAFGSTLTPILKEVAHARRVDIAAKLKHYGLHDTPANRLIAAEEVLAELAQTQPRLNLVQRALAAIRTWLRQHIPALRDLPLSDSELIHNYITPARQFVEQGHVTKGDTKAKFSRGVDELFKPLAAEAEAFRGTLDKAINSKASYVPPLELGSTPAVLRALGLAHLPTSITRDTVRKATNGVKHAVDMGTIQQLPELLADPMAVLESKTQQGSLVVLIDAIEAGKGQVMVALRPDTKAHRLVVHQIASVYGRSSGEYNSMAANGGALYVRTKQNPATVRVRGLQLPKSGSPSRGSHRKILSEADIVKFAQQENTPRASEDPLFSRSTPETVIGALNQAVKGPRGLAWARVKQLFSNLNPKHLRENTRPAWLGALTLRHLAELGKDIGLKQVNDYANLVQQMATLRTHLQERAAQTADTWERFQRQHKAHADAMANLMFDATLAGVDPETSYTPLTVPDMQYGQQLFEAEALTPAVFRARRRAMAFALKRATGKNRAALLDQRQQLNTRWQQEKARLRAYPALQHRFAALPETGQTLYRQVRDTYREQSAALEQALVARIEALIEDGNTRAATLARMRQKFESARLRGPYFPLQRFGTFWIHATDKHGEPAFMMYETVQAWQQAQRDLRDEGFSIQQAGRKLEEASQLRGASGSFITDLQHLLERHGTDPALRDEVYQLYLRTLPDVSLRKHYLHRKGTAGYSRDALRAFSANLFHGSFQIARLQFSHQLDTTLQAMKAQVKQLAKTDAERAANAATLYSEMGKRHDWVMNPRDSKAANALTSLGFAWYLGATPAAALVNLSQTAIVALPVLAAKFGSAKALKALTDTMALSLRSQTGDLRTRLNTEERAAYQQWHAMGTIDKSQAHNLAGLSETDSHAFNPHARRAMHVISWLFHRAEVVNREATALAAYRLARRSGMDHEAAITYGHEAVMESHFDYSNANRARWMQSNAAKVLLLFRQYSLNMTWFLWRNLYQSLQGQDAQTKKEARTKLMGVLGMTGLFSGVMGLPLMSVVFGVADAAAAALGDDDEAPFDSKVAFRNFLADYLGKDSARLLAKGPVDTLTGASIGARVSLDELWLRSPNRELEGQAMAHYLLEQAAGPLFGGMLTNTLRGLQQIQNGHTWRGIETMLPKALKDGMKALRYADEGANTLKGEPLIDEMSAQESLLQLSGFAPARLNERYEGMNAAQNFEKKLLDRRRRLMNAFLRARQRGDGRAGQRALEHIRAFNRKQPRLAITADTLRQSLRTRQRHSATAFAGAALNPRIAQQAHAQARFAE